MATANSVLKIAAAEIGKTDGTKYGAANRSIAWCAYFVSWCFKKAGQSVAGLPGSYCPTIMSKAAGLSVSKKSAKPGDIVLYDWNGNGNADHIGIVEKNYGSYIQAIEGNTSSGSKKSVVARRTRDFKWVLCVIRPKYGSSTGSSGSSTSSTVILGDMDWFGPKFAKELQKQLGTTADGYLSGQAKSDKDHFWAVSGGVKYGTGGSDAIRKLQTKLKAAGYSVGSIDGCYGKSSITGHQKWLKKKGYYKGTVDGYHGHETNQAMGKALKAGAYKKI